MPMKIRSHTTAVLAAALLCAIGWSATAPAAESPENPEVAVHAVDGEFRTTVSMFVAAPRQRVWDVIADYDRAAEFMRDLQVSKVLSRTGDTLRVLQKDQIRFGPFSIPMESLRDVRLKEPVSIEARLVSGSMKKYEAKTELKQVAGGTRMIYHSIAVAGSALGAFATESMVARQTEDRFKQIRDEILRREVFAAKQ